MPENSDVGTNVGTAVTATDDDNDTLTYSLGGTDASSFDFDTSTGQITTKTGITYDFEGTNSYTVTVDVRDSKDSDGDADTADDDSITVTITVLDLNETPVVSGSAAENFAEIKFDVDPATLTEADYEIGSYTAYDDDSVAWDVSGTDAAHFSIDSDGILSFAIEPDFENPADLADADGMGRSDNEYVVVVEADDGQGEPNSVGTFEVTVTVTNVNETPEVTGGSATPSHPEAEYDGASFVLRVEIYTARDEEGEAIDWSLDGNDASHFGIASGGVGVGGYLHFLFPPNYEMPAGLLDANRAEQAVGGASSIRVGPAPTPTPEPAATPTPEPTATPTPEPTATPTPEPTATPTPEPTATPTPEPTATPTPEPTATPTPEPTATPTPEPTATPTPEPTATPTAEPTAAPTAEPTATPTPEPTATPTPEPAATPTPEPAAAPTPEPAATPAPEPAATLAPEPEEGPPIGLLIALIGAGAVLAIVVVNVYVLRRRR